MSTVTTASKPERKPRATKAKVAAPVAPTPDIVPENADTAKKLRVKKTAVVVEDLPPVEEDPEPVEEKAPDGDETKVSMKRRKAREAVLVHIDSLVKDLTEELAVEKKGTDNYKRLNRFSKTAAKIHTSFAKLDKPRKRNVELGEDRKRSGFLKPSKISEEMADFAGWDPSELKSRTDVTQIVCNYVKANNLQDEHDRRIIHPDKKLATLLEYDGSTSLNFANMQKYIKKHFISGAAVEA